MLVQADCNCKAPSFLRKGENTYTNVGGARLRVHSQLESVAKGV